MVRKCWSRARGVFEAAVFAVLVALACAPARAADVPQAEPPVEASVPSIGGLRWISPFSKCEMNCTATVFVGRYVETSMTSIFLTFKNTPPWQWKFDDSTLISGAFNREVLVYDDLWAFETELGAGKRFGKQDEWELWGALYFRWKKFPWHDYLRTTIGVSTGVNWASDVSKLERLKSVGDTSPVLHYLSPEITFGLPSQPNFDLVFRFHHRSGGGLGIFDNTRGGSQYQTVGLRYRW